MLASTDILTLCIDFVWVALDHYVDCVRHSAKTILSDLVQIGDFIYNKGGSDVNFGDVIINMVVKLPSYKKSKYIALAVLANEFGFKKLKNVFPDLVSTLLEVLEDPSMSSHASNAFESLMMKNFKEENEANWVDIWIFPLFNAYSKSKVCYILENIIAKAMTICPAIMNYAMASLKEDAIESSKLKVIIVCLKTGAKLGMLDKVYAQTNASNMWKGIIKYDSLMLALVNGDDEIRLAALSLIVESNKTTRSFDTLELELVKCFLWYNINSDGASLKQKNLMLQKKVLTRIRESAYPLMKTVKLKKENDPQVVKARRILEAYNKYLKWLYIFCYKCLFPGANSTRQASALEILVLIDEIFSSENGKLLGVDGSKLFESKEHEDFANLLLTCLRDSFESNKNLAFKMLIRFPTESLSFKEQSWIHDYLHVGLKLASSVKPPDCITAAYLLKFVVSFSEADKILIEEASKVVSSDFLPNIDIIAKDISFYQKNTFYIIWILFEQLRKELAIGNQNLLLAAGSGPMYGTLFSIRHLLNTLDYNEVAENTMWKALILKLITLCFELNEAVIHVVNSSSPEGHLPMDFEPASHHDAVKKVDSALEDGNQDFILKHPVTAQMLLLCSWRTVKEVSLFLGEVSYQAPIQKKILGNDEECYLLSEDLVLRIGEYFTKLLSETKHRGAFEQAYVGFCQLCKKLWRHPAGILSSLPKVWLKDILNAIIKGKKSSKLCATRRSAGVPFIVQALVTTEINVRQPTSLKESMDILLGLLEKTETVSDEKNEEVDEVESRTHAMNILRALFRHTLLGEYVIPYIARGIMAAIKGFKGHTWAERNSATLLFGALIIRIFGVKHSREDMHRRNRMTGRVFFERFPLLYDFILEELKVASVAAPSGDFSCDQQLTPCIHPSLFPLLVLLSRLYPSSLEGTDSNMQLSAFIPPLKFCLKSKIYKIRELTARAIVPLIASNVYITHLNEAFNEVVSIEVDQNYLHGVLLQISMLLLEVPYPQKETRECLSKSVDFWVSPSVKILTDGPQINCMVKEAYVRVLRHLLLISSSSVNSFFPEVLWNNVFYILQNCIKQFNSSSGISSQLLNLGGTTWVQRATQILLEIAVITGHSSELLVEILCSFLTSSCCVECITVALSFISSVFGEEGCECNEEEDGLPLFEWPRTNDWLNRVLIHRTHFIQDHRLAYAAVNFLLCSSDSHILQKVLKVVGYLAVSSLSIKWQKVNSDSVVIEVNPYLYLVNLWQSQPENVGRAAFFCLSTFVHEALSSEKKECLTSEIGSLYCDLLLEFSSAEKSELSRIAVAEALVNNHLLLCIPNLSFSTWDRCRAWVVALDLLGDHSECVRETAARIFRMLTFSNELLKSLSDSTRNSPVSNHQDKNSIKTGHLESDWTGPKVPIVDHPGDMIPERLKELMVLYFSRVLSPVDKYECVTTLLVLILRDDGCEEAEDNVNEERVFDKAEVNLYAEWLPLAKVCAQILCEIMDDSLLNITSFIPSSVMLLVGLEDFEASSVLDFLKAAVLRITKKIEACEKTNGMIFNSFLTPGYDLIQKEAFKIGFVLSSLKTKSDEILILCDNFFQRLANSEILLRFSVLCER
ncbi:tRNA (32-2'-O)-methyltransferase regulator THADA isoform X2 [Hetaerina americana]